VGLFETAYTVRLTTTASLELRLYSLRLLTLTPNSSSSWGAIKTLHLR
jgi:hypothetical protein